MKNKMLVLGFSMLTLLTTLLSTEVKAQDANQFTVPLSDPAKRGRIKVHLNSGSIVIKGTARKDVLIKYSTPEDDSDDKKSKSSKDGLKRIGGGGMDLEITEVANSVKVESGSWNHKVDIEVEVPSGMDVDAHTYNDGDIMITNIQGELEITNYNGEITALNISGSVVATTYNGEIKVTFDKVTEGAPMSYSTYNGDIDLTFPSSLKASLKMKTEQGEILTDFDVNITKSGPVQKKDTKSGVYRVVIDEWKRADINGGGAEFSLKNYNGDIIVRKK